MKTSSLLFFLLFLTTFASAATIKQWTFDSGCEGWTNCNAGTLLETNAQSAYTYFDIPYSQNNWAYLRLRSQYSTLKINCGGGGSYCASPRCVYFELRINGIAKDAFTLCENTPDPICGNPSFPQRSIDISQYSGQRIKIEFYAEGASGCSLGWGGRQDNVIIEGEQKQGACGNGLCEYGETTQSCIADCPGFCGDGFCSSKENRASCASDCNKRPDKPRINPANTADKLAILTWTTTDPDNDRLSYLLEFQNQSTTTNETTMNIDTSKLPEENYTITIKAFDGNAYSDSSSTIIQVRHFAYFAAASRNGTRWTVKVTGSYQGNCTIILPDETENATMQDADGASSTFKPTWLCDFDANDFYEIIFAGPQITRCNGGDCIEGQLMVQGTPEDSQLPNTANWQWLLWLSRGNTTSNQTPIDFSHIDTDGQENETQSNQNNQDNQEGQNKNSNQERFAQQTPEGNGIFFENNDNNTYIMILDENENKMTAGANGNDNTYASNSDGKNRDTNSANYQVMPDEITQGLHTLRFYKDNKPAQNEEVTIVGPDGTKYFEKTDHQGRLPFDFNRPGEWTIKYNGQTKKVIVKMKPKEKESGITALAIAGLASSQAIIPFAIAALALIAYRTYPRLTMTRKKKDNKITIEIDNQLKELKNLEIIELVSEDSEVRHAAEETISGKLLRWKKNRLAKGKKWAVKYELEKGLHVRTELRTEGKIIKRIS